LQFVKVNTAKYKLIHSFSAFFGCYRGGKGIGFGVCIYPL